MDPFPGIICLTHEILPAGKKLHLLVIRWFSPGVCCLFSWLWRIVHSHIIDVCLILFYFL